jgi:hypothetical protein
MRSTVVTTNISGIHYENITRASSTAWSDITPKHIHLEPVTQGDGPPFGSWGCFLVIKGSPLVENVSPTGLAASFLSDEEIWMERRVDVTFLVFLRLAICLLASTAVAR